MRKMMKNLTGGFLGRQLSKAKLSGLLEQRF
jgi:hypothetical protein